MARSASLPDSTLTSISWPQAEACGFEPLAGEAEVRDLSVSAPAVAKREEAEASFAGLPSAAALALLVGLVLEGSGGGR